MFENKNTLFYEFEKELYKKEKHDETFLILNELMENMQIDEIANKLFVHKGTMRRWLNFKKVPDSYYNDINHLLGNKYKNKNTYRKNDQFYTSDKISNYCYQKTLDILKQLDIDASKYIFIEPSAGCCNFYNTLPKERRIGIDIDPKGPLADELIKINYLDFIPEKNYKYLVIGNPPFGLRGNLALRFINHSYNFADLVAFILPPLFNSTGKGVPMTRIFGYKLVHSEKLPLDSFEYPNGSKVNVSTIFQIWSKINTEKIKIEQKKTCKSFIKIFSLSDGGTPSSTRNKNMIGKCDLYLPSTCFSGMKIYDSFEELPNKRGYGVVFLKEKIKLEKLFLNIKWEEVAFLSTNSAINLRTDLIENEIIKMGFYDE